MSISDENHEEIARSIFNDMLNNDWDSADKKITKYSQCSPILSYCGAFQAVIKAILLFENDQFKIAVKNLDDCQKMCQNNESGTLFVFKRLFSVSSTPVENPGKKIVEKIMNEIISADCKLYSAALAVAQHNSLASVIGGVLNLRSAWITYESTHRKLKNMLGSYEDSENDLTKKDVEKLLAAVSYGYGIVQLCFSFLGSYLMKIANFFGFESDRQIALKALHYCSESEDVRSPFADSVLILYSTIGVWLFGYSEIEYYIPANRVDLMIEKNLAKSSESCLFFYMKAKYYQILIKNSERALQYLEITFRNAKNAKEIEALIYYEMTILHLTDLNYTKAKESFLPFSQVSHWSWGFNAYVNILLDGCLNDFKSFKEDLEKALKTPKKYNPIDFYTNKRLLYLKKIEDSINQELCEFFIIEMLYLWVLMPYCSEEKSNQIIKKLECRNEKDLIPIKNLILGSIHMKTNKNDDAQKHFDQVLKCDTNSVIAKYCHPYTYCHMTLMSLSLNKIDDAKQHLKQANKFSNFELHDRLFAQLRSIERQITDAALKQKKS